MNLTLFGTMPEGTPVYEAVLRSGPFTAKIIGWGAVLRDLRMALPEGPRPLVLGFERLAHYLDHSRNQGANVGRYGGRTRDGRLVIDGQSFPLSRNLDGRHHLHGGFNGLGRRNWTFLEVTPSSTTLEIHSPDGDEGYPGNLVLRCRYELHRWGLGVELAATTSAPTPVNILHHSYFNLDGEGQIAGHSLQIEAENYLEFDAEGLPTGRLLPVAGSALDCRSPRLLVADERIDASFVVAPRPLATPAHVATLLGSRRDLRMHVRTTEPGLHVYNGFAAAAPVPGLDGRPHLPSSGLCLEATRFNDAVNIPALGDVILRPGETYRQETRFAFEPAPS
ncbi:aldose epimerase family protein [Mesorhizobium sp. CAU 1741]|uniref:aldose epimerase family protein n=1 Tax=Mesorhizobium sp. CAU 1741 TaxID=3140366 RepID=UPI00325B95C1